MLTLFPPIAPYTEHELSVDNIHTLHIEECGNKNGIPILFIHGGPGAGCHADHRRYFDPNAYRIILFDQRGAGKSKPHAELKNNTTHDLVSDIEKIRNLLKIDRWMVFGGSWGSTLGLVYAEMHPERVISLILRGIFLCRQIEFDWFYRRNGANLIFPGEYKEFIEHLPIEERDEILQNYYRRLTGKDEVARMGAALAWAKWEAVCSTLEPSSNTLKYLCDPHTALSLSRIETHYFMNHIFLESNYIINHAHRLKDIPGVIVHGRYDMICPFENAYALHEAWPNSRIMIIPAAGHSAAEPGIVNALVHATNEFVKQTV